MAFSPRADEKLILPVAMHWWSYKFSIVWLFFMSLSAFGTLLGDEPGVKKVVSFIMIMIIGSTPVLIRRFQNKHKNYALTNQRFFIEEGIIGKVKKDINLDKINDVEMRQNAFQAMVGAGDLLILTGNDFPKVITNISHPETVKDQIGNVIHNKQAAKTAA